MFPAGMFRACACLKHPNFLKVKLLGGRATQSSAATLSKKMPSPSQILTQRAGITAAAGTRLALQLLLAKGFRHSNYKTWMPYIVISCHYLTVPNLGNCFLLGQGVAAQPCLLPQRQPRLPVREAGVAVESRRRGAAAPRRGRATPPRALTAPRLLCHRPLHHPACNRPPPLPPSLSLSLYRSISLSLYLSPLTLVRPPCPPVAPRS